MCRGYEPEPASCALVRREVIAFLAALPLDEEAVEAAVLVANELASNAVDHAGTRFRLALVLLDDRLRIEITDGSRELPVLRPFDPLARRGRGLQMVDQLASSWSCALEPTGKTVAAEMSLAVVGV